MSDDGFGDDADGGPQTDDGLSDQPRTWSAILKVTVAFFKDYRASSVRHETITLAFLVSLILSQTAAEKAKLPWLKLALFGDLRTDMKALRHDANILEISGVELDYDGEKIPFEVACDIAEAIGLLCIIYTSPSHTEEKPRWRVLCPLSQMLPPEQRALFVSMVNGAFGCIFAVESWTLSQSYYYGAPLLPEGGRNPDHQCRLIEGTPINLKTELLAGAVGKPGTKAPETPEPNGSAPVGLRQYALDEAALTKAISEGDALHTPAIRLVGRWAGHGVPLALARKRLIAAFDACPPAVRDTERWRTRREQDIPRILDYVYGKELDKQDSQQDSQDSRTDETPEEAAARHREGLYQGLAKSKDGVVYGTHANLKMLLEGDPRLRGLVIFNAFTHQTLLTRPVPDPRAITPRPELDHVTYPRMLEDVDVTGIAIYLQDRWSRQFKLSTTLEGLVWASRQQAFHPARDWLNSLEWDGKPRLDMWLCEVFDATPDKYTKAVAAKTLIGACRRLRHPGCPFDYMLILEGRQQIGKSTALRILFGEAWYTDNLPADIASKDAQLGLSGKWCVEFGELTQLLRNSHEALKAFISRRVDHYRPPFGKSTIDVPRQTVLVGTTNRDDYLSDITGNRRYWPIKCLLGAGYRNRFADLDWLQTNREQVWAEAAYREAAGEAEWLDDEQIAATALFHQHARVSGEPWRDTVLRYAEQNWPVTVAQIMGEALLIEPKYQDRRQEMRVADILRGAGWGSKLERDGRTRMRRWSPERANEGDAE
jgi:predicted P-loop ATPase